MSPPDELCTCGHLKSQHGPIVYRDDDFRYEINHVGHCECCDCPRFRWKGWATAFLEEDGGFNLQVPKSN